MEKFKKVRQILWIILFANLAVAFVKIIIGSLIKSSSLTADGFHSLTDGSSNIVGLIGIKLASKPVDEDHPYGHRKYETICGLFIAGMLGFISIRIITSAFSSIFNPAAPDVTLEALIALLFTLMINIFVSIYELRQGKKLKSDILISDSMHTRSDIFISLGVLVTLICLKLGLPPIIDPIASLIVSGFILHAAYEIIVSTSKTLLDSAVIDADIVQNIVMSYDQVKGCHKIRSRGMEDEIFVDLHILTQPDMSIEESHSLTHDIEKKLNEEFQKNIQVIFHIEPFYES